jgi:hypothetical protein
LSEECKDGRHYSLAEKLPVIRPNQNLTFRGIKWRAYLLSPVPEAETNAMLLAGLGLIGFMARRKQNG